MDLITDQDFLTKITELYSLINTQESILLINRENTIIFAGAGIEEITGLKPKDLIGTNFINSLPLKENKGTIVNSFNNVIKHKTAQESLSINLNHISEYIVLNVIQTPLINPSTANVVAVSVISKKPKLHTYLHKFITFILEDKSLKPNQTITHQDPLLTLREHEIAFLLFYFKSSKTIAFILENLYQKPISAKTIANIISFRLYTKFNAYGIESLIDKLYQLGYHKNIPTTFMLNIFLDLN